MNGMADKLTDSEAMGFIGKVEEPFKNLPHLPKGLVEFFVKVAPWLALLSAVLSLLFGPIVAILGSLGSLLTLSPMLFIGTVGTAVVMLLNAVLLLMAFKPLQNREMKGWVFLFWSQLLSVVMAVLTLIEGSGSTIVSTLISTAIGLYVLFEMKPFYGGAQAAVEKVKKATK
jgi:hypothetical protein